MGEVVSTKKEINTAYDAIMHYKKQGAHTVSVHTKNYGQILLRISPYYVFAYHNYYEQYFRFDPVKENLYSYMQREMEQAFSEKDLSYKKMSLFCDCFSSCSSIFNFNLLTFDNLSKVEPINSDYISLDNFYAIYNTKLGNQSIKFGSLFHFECDSEKFLKIYPNIYLNVSEITSIQPLYFAKESLETSFKQYSEKAIEISASEFNKFKDMFKKYNAKNIIYKVFDTQDCKY